MSDSVSINTMPDAVAPVAELMSSYPARWSICGGWAVDAWLGRLSRDHGDVDVSIFIQDQRVLFEHLADWQLVAHDPRVRDDTSEPWDGVRPLELPAHIHARPNAGEAWPERMSGPVAQSFYLDIQIDDRQGEEWILCRDPLVSIPLDKAVAISPWGVPTAVPGVLLYFKARDLRRRDRLDFAALLPHLDQDQRTWLREAIAHLRHPWLGDLEP